MGTGANDGSPATDTLWPGVTVSSVLMPASRSSVVMYTPAAPENTAETKVWMSGPRYPPSVYGETNGVRKGEGRHKTRSRRKGQVTRTAPPTQEYSSWCSSHDIFESSPPMFSSSW